MTPSQELEAALHRCWSANVDGYNKQAFAELQAVIGRLAPAIDDSERFYVWFASRNCLLEHGVDQRKPMALSEWRDLLDRLPKIPEAVKARGA